MKKIIRILSFVVLLSLFVGIFVGCANSKAKIEIKVSGSSSVTPLMQKLAQEYEKNNDVTISIITHDSGTGIKDTQEGLNEIGMASRSLKSTETGLDSVKICDDGIALIVNKDLSITGDSVSGSQIYSLYKDGIAIEGILRGISREASSGTRGAFDELIKNTEGKALKDITAFAAVISEQNSTGSVKTAISTATDTLGYISLGSLDNTVKALKFENVDATAENVKNGSYKLARPFILVKKSDTELSTQATAFINFILSEAGQAIVAQEGYISM
ncbi:MAG: substrate-binding domain-containing protein [Christensenellaceae bacterium]|jgi:phosphate transport system substrate-binding protein|nr:substrate-binding domain-containing protein [Christensenellaceae bacterium]